MTQTFRTEKDFLGKRQIPADALYGIHALRAKENFPGNSLFHPEWYMAMGVVKQACYVSYRNYAEALQNRLGEDKLSTNRIASEVIDALILAAGMVAEGSHFGQFIVPAVSGGAGTSINMNVNEIISNLALQQLGHPPGTYHVIDPVETANIFQSTNDVVPTALRVAAMKLLSLLESAINGMRQTVEALETAHQQDLRIAFTQMQEAVPSSFGRLFSTYSEALSRDWWRVSKCFERLKLVNLGGGAIGSGLSIPRFYIMDVVQELRKLTNLPLGRSENMQDVTCNLDVFVEVHAILKAHAVNLEKIAADLRLLSSGFIRPEEFSLPPRQMGSTIMPGKVNPVIPEYVISVAHKVYANDVLIASLSGQGALELNAYLPLIGHALLDSMKLLISACNTMKDNMLINITVHADAALLRLYSSPSVTTALIPAIGYHQAAKMAGKMKEEGLDVFRCNSKYGFMDEVKLKEMLQADKLVKLGYTLDDIQ